MLKIKPQKLFSNRRRIFIAAVVVLCVALVAWFVYQEFFTAKRAIRISDKGSEYATQDNYTAAAGEYVKAYNAAPDDATRANMASNAAQAYEAQPDYPSAVKWYTIALEYYQKVEDDSGISNAKDSLIRVAEYSKTFNKPESQTTTNEAN